MKVSYICKNLIKTYFLLGDKITFDLTNNFTFHFVFIYPISKKKNGKCKCPFDDLKRISPPMIKKNHRDTFSKNYRSNVSQ